MTDRVIAWGGSGCRRLDHDRRRVLVGCVWRGRCGGVGAGAGGGGWGWGWAARVVREFRNAGVGAVRDCGRAGRCALVHESGERLDWADDHRRKGQRLPAPGHQVARSDHGRAGRRALVHERVRRLDRADHHQRQGQRLPGREHQVARRDHGRAGRRALEGRRREGCGRAGHPLPRTGTRYATTFARPWSGSSSMPRRSAHRWAALPRRTIT